MGAIAQMERELKAERAAAGRAAAKARGRTGGRPRTDPDKLEQARILYLHSDKTAAEVCHMVGIGRRTLFSYLTQVKRRALTTSAHEPSSSTAHSVTLLIWNFARFVLVPPIGLLYLLSFVSPLAL